MEKKIILTALIFGVFAIILGAFGAHALKKVLTVEQLTSFEVGIKYLMYHALFLLFLGTTQMVLPNQKRVIYYLTLSGTILFSGSILLLTTNLISGLDFKFLGPITPVGGLLLISAWIYLFVIILKNK